MRDLRRHKVSVLFPENLLCKVRLFASLRGESLSQAILRLTQRGLSEEFGEGFVDPKVLERLAGSIEAGGDALRDSEDLYL